MFSTPNLYNASFVHSGTWLYEVYMSGALRVLASTAPSVADVRALACFSVIYCSNEYSSEKSIGFFTSFRENTETE